MPAAAAERMVADTHGDHKREEPFFGDTCIQLVGACRNLAASIEYRSERLNSRLDDASQRIQMLHLDVGILGESVSRPF